MTLHGGVLDGAPARPGLKVLLTTGYGQTTVPDGTPDAGFELIAKPFTYATLAAKLRAVLEK